ncbi:MAG: PAS domain-containing protein [Desulfobacterales bacterium]|nr:PAS domain-containing protein [Desulfobacterales bacterium]MDD4072759.1 PAS domain-containing protein [Desulfobacterales bacterium]MDD4392475.1 PAS domain-containing protein [Desulfobacterales bacterium]
MNDDSETKQDLINSVPVPIFYKDARGVYTGCNPAFERFTGLGKNDIIGRTVYDIAPKHLADIYQQKDREFVHQYRYRFV